MLRVSSHRHYVKTRNRLNSSQGSEYSPAKNHAIVQNGMDQTVNSKYLVCRKQCTLASLALRFSTKDELEKQITEEVTQTEVMSTYFNIHLNWQMTSLTTTQRSNLLHC